MEHWVHISEASAILKKPERTLRLHAAQGKIKTKKEGKFWLFEVSKHLKSLAPPPPSSSSTESTPFENSSDSTRHPEDITNEEIEELIESNDVRLKRKKKKSYKLEDLGVFKDLRILTERVLAADNSSPLGKLLKAALIQVGEGFYEYEPQFKIEKFRSARFTLAELMVECSMIKETNPTTDLIKEHVHSNIMPGLSGLIRKIITKTRSRRDQNYGNRDGRF